MADQILFRVHRSEILPALDAIFEGVDQRGSIPILANVLLVPDGGELMLRGTDLAIEIETTCDLLETGSGSPITVCAADLREIVKNLPESAEITLAPGAFPDQIRVQSGRSRFSLLSLPAGDFPSLSERISKDPFSLEIAPLIAALTKVSYAIKEDKTRFYLSGACLHPVDGNRLAIVGTDGHNFALVRLDVDQQIDFRSIIIPIKTLKAIRKLFGESKGRIDVTITDALIRLSMNGVTVISKLVDGTFPGYERIIPANNNRVVTSSVATFRAAVQRVCVVADDLEKDTIRLRLEPGVMKVTMKTAAGEEAAEDIPIEYDGSELDIGFNGRYLTAMLSVVSTQDVEMRFNDAETPGLFRPTIECDEHYVINVRRL